MSTKITDLRRAKVTLRFGITLQAGRSLRYVEPGVNRQPGFRRELAEQNQQIHRMFDSPSWGCIQFGISK